MADEIRVEKSTMIALDQIEMNDWNPFKQDDEVFNQLVTEMEQEGFDEPILVAKLPDGKYRVVNGEHRFKAARVLKLKEIPCIVKETWDEDEQMIQTVRRNNLRGKLDMNKLERMGQRLSKRILTDPEKVARRMLLKDEALFAKFSEAKAQESNANREIAEKMDETRTELTMIDNLSALLNDLFGQYGKTVPFNFMVFMYKEKQHMVVQMRSGLVDAIRKLETSLFDKKIDANAFFSRAIEAELLKLDNPEYKPSGVPDAPAPDEDLEPDEEDPAEDEDTEAVDF